MFPIFVYNTDRRSLDGDPSSTCVLLSATAGKFLFVDACALCKYKGNSLAENHLESVLGL